MSKKQMGNMFVALLAVTVLLVYGWLNGTLNVPLLLLVSVPVGLWWLWFVYQFVKDAL